MLELGNALLQIPLDDGDVLLQVGLVRGIVGGGEDAGVAQRGQHMPADGLNLADAVDLVPKELNAQGMLVLPGRDDLHHVPPHAEGAPVKLDIVALVLDVDEHPQQLVPADGHARAQGDHLSLVLAGVAHGVDAAHRRDDDHVLALPQGRGGGVAHAVDFLVDGGVLLDVGIRGGDVGLRLIVVVVGDEVLHPAVREEGLQLRAELGGQGLVVGNDQGGLLHLLDYRSHGEGLAGAGNAQQHLLLQTPLHALGQGGDGFRLIAAGRVGCFEYKSAFHAGHLRIKSYPSRIAHPARFVKGNSRNGRKSRVFMDSLFMG